MDIGPIPIIAILDTDTVGGAIDPVPKSRASLHTNSGAIRQTQPIIAPFAYGPAPVSFRIAVIRTITSLNTDPTVEHSINLAIILIRAIDYALFGDGVGVKSYDIAGTFGHASSVDIVRVSVLVGNRAFIHAKTGSIMPECWCRGC